MRYLTSIILLATLTGCSLFSTRRTDTSESPLTGTAAEKYANKADLIMSRAAAAVVTARKANLAGDPIATERELSVAEAYLPRPKKDDEIFAEKRVSSASDSEYSEALKTADQHQNDLWDTWQLVVAEFERAKNASEAKVAEQEGERKMVATYVFTGIGGLLILVGTLSLIFGLNRTGSALAIGIGTMSIGAVWFFDSPSFAWAAFASWGLLVLWGWYRIRSHSTTAHQPKQGS